MQLGADKDTEDQLRLLYQGALIRAGFEIKDLSAFQKVFQNMMKDQFGIPRTVNRIELSLPEETEPVKETPKVEEAVAPAEEEMPVVEEQVDSFEQSEL